MVLEFVGFQKIPERDAGLLAVRHLDADRGFARDRGFHVNARRGEIHFDVVGKRRDTGNLHADVRLDLVTRDRRAAGDIRDTDVDAESLQGLDQISGILLKLGFDVLTASVHAGASSQEPHGRETILLLNRFLGGDVAGNDVVIRLVSGRRLGFLRGFGAFFLRCSVRIQRLLATRSPEGVGIDDFFIFERFLTVGLHFSDRTVRSDHDLLVTVGRRKLFAEGFVRLFRLFFGRFLRRLRGQNSVVLRQVFVAEMNGRHENLVSEIKGHVVRIFFHRRVFLILAAVFVFVKDRRVLRRGVRIAVFECRRCLVVTGDGRVADAHETPVQALFRFHSPVLLVDLVDLFTSSQLRFQLSGTTLGLTLFFMKRALSLILLAFRIFAVFQIVEHGEIHKEDDRDHNEENVDDGRACGAEQLIHHEVVQTPQKTPVLRVSPEEGKEAGHGKQNQNDGNDSPDEQAGPVSDPQHDCQNDE